MGKCIESLLLGGDRVEIIIINDGSKDGTGAIADRYAAQYPGVVRVISVNSDTDEPRWPGVTGL